MTDASPERVYRALVSGALGAQDLSARRLSAFLGATTSRIYHHHGSLDLFLLEVAQLGFAALAQRMSGSLDEQAEAYLELGFRCPALYDLMFVRAYPWAEARSRGLITEAPAMQLWASFIEALKARGSTQPAADARALYSALHGSVLLARSGRANVGDAETDDEESARASIHHLLARMALGSQEAS